MKEIKAAYLGLVLEVLRELGQQLYHVIVFRNPSLSNQRNTYIEYMFIKRAYLDEKVCLHRSLQRRSGPVQFEIPLSHVQPTRGERDKRNKIK
jgi:hypothetical protein